MKTEYKGYEIWTEQTEHGFRARVRPLDRSRMNDQTPGEHPASDEFSTMDNFRSEEVAMSEVKVWINHGMLDIAKEKSQSRPAA